MHFVRQITFKMLWKMLLTSTFIYFTWLMILITAQYFPFTASSGFLQIKQEEMQLVYYPAVFVIHVYTSIFVLITGAFQFSNYIRTRYRKFHRSLGKFYITVILTLAGPTGLVIGFHANGGMLSQAAFCILAILWIWFTWQAYRYARKGDWIRHRNFMYRSYALTLSAISLRLFKWIIVTVWELPPMDTYIIVAWLGWMVNLAVAEWLIRQQTKRSDSLGEDAWK